MKQAPGIFYKTTRQFYVQLSIRLWIQFKFTLSLYLWQPSSRSNPHLSHPPEGGVFRCCGRASLCKLRFCLLLHSTKAEFNFNTGVWKRKAFYYVTLRRNSCQRGRGYPTLGLSVKGTISCKVQSHLQIMWGCALISNGNSSVYFNPWWLTWDTWRRKWFLGAVQSTKISYSLHFTN